MSYWLLSKTFRFEASHQLPHHDGLCARLHGHSWIGKIYVLGTALKTEPPECGMVTDFIRIKTPIQEYVDLHLDHRHLNDSLHLENPTSEEIARVIYQAMQYKIPKLAGVSIEETCTSACYYTEEDDNIWKTLL